MIPDPDELPDGVTDSDEDAADQDDMAAAWAASMDDDANSDDDEFDMAAAMGGGDDDEDNSRLLNQDEIDSLLGFDDAGGDDTISGIHAIVNSSMVSYERLPMLEVVFDRLVRLMSTSLRNFTSDNVEITLDNITSIRFGDYLNSIPLPALLAVTKAEEWDNMALLTVDSALTYSVVDVLLGGRHGGMTMRVEGRPYTTIERNLIERMISVVLGDMSAAFDPLSPVNFHFERLETNPRFATIARPANAAVLVKLRIDMEDRGGRMEFCLPYATLEPVREILLQMFMGEKFGRDSIWENHLASELWLTDVPINAVLGELVLPLNEIIGWKPGTRIEFNTTPDTPMELRCGDVPLFSGQVGQRNSHIALKVDNKLIKTVPTT